MKQIKTFMVAALTLVMGVMMFEFRRRGVFV